MQFYIHLSSGDLTGKKEFPIKSKLSIGRDAENDIVLINNNVSRKHALIYQDENVLRIKDLGSHNGTLLNGRLVRDEVMQDDDIVLIADIEMKLVRGEVDLSASQNEKLTNEDIGLDALNSTSFIDLSELDVEKMKKIREEKPSNTDHWQD